MTYHEWVNESLKILMYDWVEIRTKEKKKRKEKRTRCFVRFFCFYFKINKSINAISCGVSTVDHQARTSHKRGFWRAQENDGFCYFFRPSKPLHGHVLGCILFLHLKGFIGDKLSSLDPPLTEKKKGNERERKERKVKRKQSIQSKERTNSTLAR